MRSSAAHRSQHTELPHGVLDVGTDRHYELEHSKNETDNTRACTEEIYNSHVGFHVFNHVDGVHKHQVGVFDHRQDRVRNLESFISCGIRDYPNLQVLLNQTESGNFIFEKDFFANLCQVGVRLSDPLAYVSHLIVRHEHGGASFGNLLIATYLEEAWQFVPSGNGPHLEFKLARVCFENVLPKYAWFVRRDAVCVVVTALLENLTFETISDQSVDHLCVHDKTFVRLT